jgi:hypothetical protein
MIVLTEHVPSFVQRAAPRLVTAAETTEQLLETDWIKSWRSVRRGFHRFSVADGYYLMAEFDAGEHYYVVGMRSIEHDEFTGLPNWRANRS